MRKFILLTLIALFAGFQPMQAVPARPGKFVAVQPDGTRLVLERHGDEWGHWYTDASGRMLRRDKDGFYRVLTDAEVTDLREVSSARRSARRQSQARRAAHPRKKPVVGQRHFLVILVEFADQEFNKENDRQAFIDMMNLPGYSRNGATGSARDFYFENSDGRFEPIFDVYGPVKLEKPYAYYGQNDAYGEDMYPGEAVVQGCTALDDEVDFSLYDDDGDGKVDLVFMYYAGYGEADGDDENTIWPHQYELTLFGLSLTLDGVQVDSYACANELVTDGELKDQMAGIGTACHEFAHAMGVPDFYDTNGSTEGLGAGLYSYSLMDYGPYNNEGRTPPYFNFEERLLLGWVDESDFLEFKETGTYTIPHVSTNVAYRTLTDKDGEYFVYENRTWIGWDRYLPAEGLIVYHVDKSDNAVSRYWTARELWDNCMQANTVNAYGSHPCFYIVPAASQTYEYYYYEKRMPFPYQRINTFVPKSWSGAESMITFSQISKSGGQVSLWANVPSGEVDFVTIADAGSYRAGDRFTFDLVRPEHVDAPASVVWYYDDEPAGADSVTLTAGGHVVEARVTWADGRSETVTLEITVN